MSLSLALSDWLTCCGKGEQPYKDTRHILASTGDRPTPKASLARSKLGFEPTRCHSLVPSPLSTVWPQSELFLPAKHSKDTNAFTGIGAAKGLGTGHHLDPSGNWKTLAGKWCAAWSLAHLQHFRRMPPSTHPALNREDSHGCFTLASPRKCITNTQNVRLGLGPSPFLWPSPRRWRPVGPWRVFREKPHRIALQGACQMDASMTPE